MMTKKGSLICGMFLALSSVAIVNSCLAAPVEINFWHGLTASDGDTLGQMVKSFEKESGIKVKVQKIDWATLYDKLLVSMAGGKAPEVFIVHRDEFKWLLDAKAIRPLDAYFNGPGGIPKDDRVQTAWKAVESNGKLYGVPLDNHNFNLIYNTEHFKEAGLDPQRPPTNGEEFVMIGSKLKKETNGKVSRWGYLLENPYWDFCAHLYQNGGYIINDSMTKSIINSEEAVNALKTVSSYKNIYKFAEFLGIDEFIRGKGSMCMMGPWHENILTKAKNLSWAPAVIPQFGPVKASPAGSHVMYMPPTISGKKLEASIKFIKWISDHSATWATSGQIPVRKSVLESPEFKAMKLQSTYAKMLPYSVFEPMVVRRRDDVKNAWWGNAAWKVMNGKGDAKQELDKAADMMNRLLAIGLKK